MFGVIGPNGAGKTTLLNVVSGSYPPDGGEVHHRGKPITGKPLRTVVEQGIVRTFQLTTVFPEMTVLENIAVGCHLRHRPSFVGEICSSPRARRAAGNEERLARDIAESVGLQAHQHHRTGLLPYGLQKALSIGIIWERYLDQGRHIDEVLDIYWEDVRACRESDPPQRDHEAITLVNIGGALSTAERHAEALPPLRDAMAISRDLDDQPGIASAAKNLGGALPALAATRTTGAISRKRLNCSKRLP
jgi:ABC-type sugar transport system ATPase subunit